MRRSSPLAALVLAIAIIGTACDAPKLAANSTAGIIERIGPVTQEHSTTVTFEP